MHFGTLRDYRFTDVEGDDVRGSKVYGVNDEKLGKIDDVIFDHTNGNVRYAVVDTGGWLSSHKFLVPPDGLKASSRHENDFETLLTKEQIETFPPYNESDLDDEKRWNDYEGRYRSKWEASPVMHRAETDRNVTPTTDQIRDLDDDTASGLPVSGRQIVTSTPERLVPPTGDGVEIQNSASGIGGRWS
ncbi:MAG TPA: PRC-barrel domain-containing protein, partial [Planctomycetota bacterium]|nr:PRC-barrel domain-containing protein [Planctomycetota bacterium]